MKEITSMATADKTDIKDRIANNKLTKQILIDMVDSYIDSIDGPLDFETEAVLQIDGTTELGVKNDGRLYGRSLHNQGDVSGVTDQYIASGTYLPTGTIETNIDSFTAYDCQWLRVGNVVTVSGSINIDAALATTTTELRLSLPISSEFASVLSCGGNGTSHASSHYFSIFSDNVNKGVTFKSANMNTANTTYSFSFTYLIEA